MMISCDFHATFGFPVVFLGFVSEGGGIKSMFLLDWCNSLPHSQFRNWLRLSFANNSWCIRMWTMQHSMPNDHVTKEKRQVLEGGWRRLLSSLDVGWDIVPCRNGILIWPRFRNLITWGDISLVKPSVCQWHKWNQMDMWKSFSSLQSVLDAAGFLVWGADWTRDGGRQGSDIGQRDSRIHGSSCRLVSCIRLGSVDITGCWIWSQLAPWQFATLWVLNKDSKATTGLLMAKSNLFGKPSAYYNDHLLCRSGRDFSCQWSDMVRRCRPSWCTTARGSTPFRCCSTTQSCQTICSVQASSVPSTQVGTRSPLGTGARWILLGRWEFVVILLGTLNWLLCVFIALHLDDF